MKNRLQFLILPIITLILEILPYGAVCNFANPDGPPWRRTYSYFSLTPFGYAHFTPFLTALLTCVILILLVIYCFTGIHSLAKAASIALFACSVLSLGPLLLGLHFFSVVGALITLTLLAQSLFLYFTAVVHK